VEDALKGETLTIEAVQRAALKAVDGAVAHGANRYKIDLLPRVVARAILTMGGMA
jgi:xanthine dehydrogenase YagS FAD-binding subunit